MKRGLEQAIRARVHQKLSENLINLALEPVTYGFALKSRDLSMFIRDFIGQEKSLTFIRNLIGHH
jgi:hypothetical protein